MRVFSWLLILFCVGVVTATNYQEYDCGWHGITEEQCVEKGCTWVQGFPGPWCQIASSPYLPNPWDIGLSNLHEDDIKILTYAIISFFILSIAVIISARTESIFINIDWIMVGIILSLAWVTRYHEIAHPKEVVFDEFYFGDFANSYCNRIYVFDIHPPLAKLTHYYFGSLLGAECTMDFHGKDGLEKYDSEAQYVPYRLISAFFGTIVIPLAYLVGRELRFSVQSSILLSALLFCDHLLLSETRLVLTDSQLFFYTVLSIFCALKLWNSKENSFGRNFWTVATAVAAGCAFCVKFTALATLGWIAFVTYLAVYTHSKPIGILRCIVAAIISAIVFSIPFYLHFQLGKRSGEMDWNLDLEHQQLLVGSPHYNPRAVAPSFPAHLIYLVKRMLEQNAASLGDHPYASFWYEWVIGKGALLSYAEHREEENWHGHIFIVSNIYICFTILVAFFSFTPLALTMLRGRFSFRLNERETQFLKTGFLMFLVWIANLLPYALVARTTYSYHYLPGQFYGMIMVCLLFEDVPYFLFSLFYKGEKLQSVTSTVRACLIILFMVGLFWSYFYYAPFSYGYGLESFEYTKRKWIISDIY